jgi:hypothetical protein
MTHQRGNSMSTERERLREAVEGGIAWRRWGPCLSERQWGTIDLVETNGRRTRDEMEYELLDTGVFSSVSGGSIAATYYALKLTAISPPDLPLLSQPPARGSLSRLQDHQLHDIPPHRIVPRRTP